MSAPPTSNAGGSNPLLLATIERLLAGQSLSLDRFGYDVSGTHLGIISNGSDSLVQLRDVASRFDLRLLAVEPEDHTVWAWISCRRMAKEERLAKLIASNIRGNGATGIGEAAGGTTGWRLTHSQAEAALSVEAYAEKTTVYYPEVALLASAQRDALLALSLYRRYMVPLESQRKGGRNLRDTLKAYFRCGLSITSSAALLQVDRRTIRNRLTKIEDLLGQPPSAIAAELTVALRMHDAGAFSHFDHLTSVQCLEMT